jgi:hypothetical protein
VPRKLIDFDTETLPALELLARDTMRYRRLGRQRYRRRGDVAFVAAIAAVDPAHGVGSEHTASIA